MLVYSNQTFADLTAMANDYRCCSLTHVMEFLTVMCILIACRAAAQITVSAAYIDVLKSRVSKIQTDINQFHDSKPISLICHHYPVHSDNSTKTVMFVWTSERETHAMQSCLYQEMNIVGNREARRLEYSTFTEAEASAEFCNRSMHASVKIEKLNKVNVLNLYFNNPQNDGLIVEETSMWYNKNDIPAATSLINVCLLYTSPSPRD